MCHQSLNQKLLNCYVKKIFIDILGCVLKNQGVDKDDAARSQNSWNVIKNNHLIDELEYSDQEAEDAKNNLIDAGLIKVRTHLLSVTPDGEALFTDFQRFKLYGFFEKITILGNKNLPILFSLSAFIISLIGLLHSLIHD